jgi:hypothetical protein
MPSRVQRLAESLNVLWCVQNLPESGMLRYAESYAGVDRVWKAAVRT